MSARHPDGRDDTLIRPGRTDRGVHPAVDSTRPFGAHLRRAGGTGGARRPGAAGDGADASLPVLMAGNVAMVGYVWLPERRARRATRTAEQERDAQHG